MINTKTADELLGSALRRAAPLLLGAAVAGFFAVLTLIGVIGTGGERVQHYSIDVVVQSNGSAQVREVIDYDFGFGSEGKHGIFRSLPGYEFTNAPDPFYSVWDVRVTSGSAPDAVELREGDFTSPAQIRIGDPSRTVTGRHRYVLEYWISDAADEDGVVSYDAVGTGWTVPIDSADITLSAPYRLDDVACDRSTGSSCDELSTGDLVTAHVDGLDAGEGVTVTGTQGRALSGPVRSALPAAVDSGTDGAPTLLVIVLVALGGLVGYAAGYTPFAGWAQRIGRDSAAAVQAPESRPFPPDGLTPAQGGVLLEDRVTDDHRAAWLAEQVSEGHLVLDDRHGLVLRRGEQWDAAPELLRSIFADRDNVALTSYDAQFAEGWQRIGDRLETWRASCGLWDMSAEFRAKVILMTAVVPGVIAAVVVAILIITTLTSSLPLAVGAAVVAGVFIGAGLSAILHKRAWTARTSAGVSLLRQVAAFRRFLSEQEAIPAAAERGMLAQYSAWAVALGRCAAWSDALPTSALPSDIGRQAARITSPSFPAAMAAASQAPSSGGGFSGGGGGGGGGGGAGGGGGGSW